MRQQMSQIQGLRLLQLGELDFAFGVVPRRGCSYSIDAALTADNQLTPAISIKRRHLTGEITIQFDRCFPIVPMDPMYAQEDFQAHATVVFDQTEPAAGVYVLVCYRGHTLEKYASTDLLHPVMLFPYQYDYGADRLDIAS